MTNLFRNNTLWKIGAIVVITMATINLDLIMKKMWSSGGTGLKIVYTGTNVDEKLVNSNGQYEFHSEEKVVDSDGLNEFPHADGNSRYSDKFHQSKGHHLIGRKTDTTESIRSEESAEDKNPAAEKWLDELDKSETSDKKKILIFTSFRSGSSLTGSLFSANPDMFYIFEPLGSYGNVPKQRTSELGCVEKPLPYCMEWLFKCEINKFLSHAGELIPSRKGWSGVMFQQAANDLHVSNKNLHQWDHICKKKYKHIAIKIIREPKLEYALPLMQQGVKVLYLMRDPRSITQSRSVFSPRPPEDDTFKECVHKMDDIKFLTDAIRRDKSLYQVFEENLRIIRYEDLANNLFENAEKIYDFIGLDMPERVKKHINSEQKVELWKPITFDEDDNIIKKNITGKISQRTEINLDKWRLRMSFEKVIEVQTVCEEVMERFGYSLMRFESQQRSRNWNPTSRVPRSLPFTL